MLLKSRIADAGRACVGPCEGFAHTRVVTACCVPKAPILLQTSDGTIPGSCRGPAHTGWLQFSLAADALRMDEQGSVGVLVHGAMFQVVGSLRWSSRRNVELWPAHVYSLSARGLARTNATPGVLSWFAPSQAGFSQVCAPIVDFSCDGVAIDASGLELPSHSFPVSIQLGRHHASALALPRDSASAGSPAHVGLRLRAHGDRALLLDAYTESIFPQFSLRKQHAAEVIGDLFAQSGYLNLRANTALPDDWLKLPGAEPISRDVVYTAQDGTVLGHVSTIRAYSQTWLGQQLSTLRGHAETPQCRLSLYRHMAIFPYLADGPSTHLLCYFNRDKRWHRAFFDDFVNWVRDDSMVVIAALDRFEPAASATSPSLALDSDSEVTPLRATEALMACALVRSCVPELLANAWDIYPEQLQSANLHPAYGQTSYHRERHVLAVRRGGQLLGVALCEVTSRALSLFNVLNMAQFFFVEGSSGAHVAAQHQLIEAARDFFRTRGEAHPLLVAPAGAVQAAALGDLEVAETMGCIVLSGPCLSFYDNFLNFQVGSFLDSKPHASRD